MIKNPSLFINEVVFGATAGAPLITGTNGLLASGLINNEQTSTTATAVGTTATTLLTNTPVAGTYLVIASGNITASSAAGNVLSTYLSVGGTQKADSVRQLEPTSTGAFAAFSYLNFAINGIVTVNGSQAIALIGISSAGTVTVTQRTMDLVRIA